ncbi:thioredoxin domain-containing protein [Candidatus Nomurabacteria bacterium]|nr:thioredoxin domain-containing protein [Candidatus Nomurabacteria bacterium]MCB9819235.1 thioredoxin domain-containing protein [Candidatus Nomurabacteria bacterium]
MLKKHFWKVVAVAVIVLIGASALYSKQTAEKANEGVVMESHIKGNPDAAVTLVEYSDFQCPACAQFNPYIEELMAEHGDDLRFEYRHFPLINIHPQAVPAAKAAEAAGQQGKFWEMHDKLFENQSTWTRSSSPSAAFNQYAEELGLDMAKFKLHLNSSTITDSINESFEDARARNFTGTPSFLLNDEKMEFSTFEEFKEQIKTAIEAAKEAN